jgi:hypothetical protein
MSESRLWEGMPPVVEKEQHEQVEFENEGWRVLQERRYAGTGITPESIVRSLQVIVRELREYPLDPLPHQESFYLNSSDPLSLLREVADVRGKRVLSVAASGDFAQLFFEQGAASVELFDVSPHASLWSELRLRAAAVLNYDEYRHFFGSGASLKMGDENYDPKVGHIPIQLFDEELFKKLAPYLSRQARALFESVSADHRTDLFVLQDKSMAEDGFARPRLVDFVGDVVTTLSEYEAMQQAIRKGKLAIYKEEVVDAAKRSAGVDVAYISNIGYEGYKTVRLAQEFRSRGAKRVLFTLNYDFNGFDPKPTLNGKYVYDKEKRRYRQKDLKTGRYLPDEDGQEVSLKVGYNIVTPEEVFLVKGIPVRFLGSTNLQYGVVAELV